MMNRKMAILAMSLAACFLTACGDDDGDNGSPPASSSSSSSAMSSSDSSSSSSAASSDASSSASSSSAATAAAPCSLDGATDGKTWCAIAFGQSVDVNFSSTILDEKVGTNYVWRNGSATPMKVTDSATVDDAVTIESRGGKIANTHDGITYYYTRLPTSQNFVLSADVTVEQFGPETSTNGVLVSTNGQEGAGVMIRDVIGTPRQDPLVVGYEEFPAASNMVVNAIMQNGKNNQGKFLLQSIYRDGVNYPWGNVGAIIPKVNFVSGTAAANLIAGPSTTIKMSMERTDTGYVIGYADADGNNAKTMTVAGANANIVQTVDKDNMYVGFFASRNARITVKNIKLSLSAANTADVPKYVAPAETVRLDVTSPSKIVGNAYTLQGWSNYNGTVAVTQDGVALGGAITVKAGDFFSVPTTISGTSSKFDLSFTAAGGAGSKTTSTTVTKVTTVADATNLYVAPNGVSTAAGTSAAPLDIATAIQVVAPGGTIHLANGTYPATTLGLDVSGSAGKLKTLVADKEGSVIFTGGFTLNASYWNIKSIEVAGAQMRIAGSFNVIDRVTVHHHVDTGMQISASGTGKALWPRNNLILNSTSYSNKDASMINADGFAAKLGVGDGNVFRGCLSYDNADDGWDLFNKIEDGANGVVTIEDSVAYNNGNNGFKLGGEGQPVAHILRRSFAFHNNLDGITDNFNPGALVLENNVSFDNVRFNYIFRPSPYGGPETQGHFSGNVSLRTDYAGKYDDAVVGVMDGTNSFIKEGRPTAAGASPNVRAASASDYETLNAPAKLTRKADGSIDFKGFLQKR